MQEKKKKIKIECGVWGHVTPYPKGYGQRLWQEVLLPELRRTAYPELMKRGREEEETRKEQEETEIKDQNGLCVYYFMPSLNQF